MKKILVRYFLTGAISIATFLASPAYADHPVTENEFGTAVHGGPVDRDILISSFTNAVNVTRGETVRFLVNGKSFSWRFDTLGTPVFDLRQIAPAGILGDRSIRAYVAEEYRG